MALIFCFIDLALMGAAAFNSNSVTILGDLLKETTDTLSVLAAFLTVRAVRRSPGQRFAYGVGKLENLVSVSIGVIMVVCALFVTVRAVHHLGNPEKAEGTLPGILVFCLYSGIAFFISARARYCPQAAVGDHGVAGASLVLQGCVRCGNGLGPADRAHL